WHTEGHHAECNGAYPRYCESSARRRGSAPSPPAFWVPFSAGRPAFQRASASCGWYHCNSAARFPTLLYLENFFSVSAGSTVKVYAFKIIERGGSQLLLRFCSSLGLAGCTLSRAGFSGFARRLFHRRIIIQPRARLERKFLLRLRSGLYRCCNFFRFFRMRRNRKFHRVYFFSFLFRRLGLLHVACCIITGIRLCSCFLLHRLHG